MLDGDVLQSPRPSGCKSGARVGDAIDSGPGGSSVPAYIISRSAPHQTLPGSRPEVSGLRDLLAQDRLARAVGVGDALGAFLATRHGFDLVWASGLSISAAHGVPDASILTMTELLGAARIIERTTPLPLLADCDSGFGGLPNVVHMVEEYERAGMDGVCFEDKTFPKRNSFVPGQELIGADEFARKIAAAKRAQSSSDFVIVARTEALIVGLPMDEALRRARLYQDAGADAILIHSKTGCTRRGARSCRTVEPHR